MFPSQHSTVAMAILGDASITQYIMVGASSAGHLCILWYPNSSKVSPFSWWQWSFLLHDCFSSNLGVTTSTKSVGFSVQGAMGVKNHSQNNGHPASLSTKLMD